MRLDQAEPAQIGALGDGDTHPDVTQGVGT
jgi:hypothetical protein